MKIIRCLCAGLILAAFNFEAQAQTVPPLINYQGRLLNPDGSPLPTADYQLTFKIFDSATNAVGTNWGPQIFDGSNGVPGDRKSTRLNSSHLVISYAVFCLKKK